MAHRIGPMLAALLFAIVWTVVVLLLFALWAQVSGENLF